ncbi:uncharacterized protein LOC129946038 [Eupeodes corollae]|uniref:uncharacterized protein LOC129946038 n=1 Tax=Eupeodes corollae TaxID=290404 RepID=UPI0024903403|nr:uncharacterized protein LOC129946038 [Eupeodes corollae]
MMDLDLSATFVNKVPQTTTTPDLYFIIKSEWSSNDINLQILDCHKSQEWEGSVSLDDLKQSAEELEIPFDKFFDECKAALTTNGGVEHFEYFLEDQKFNLTKKDQFKINYLELDVISKNDSNSNFALAAVDLIASLQAELSACKEASEDLNEKYQQNVKTMEHFLEEKNNLEKRLLDKFAVLLNSKKDKIAELQDLLVEKERLLEDAGISTEGATEQHSKRKSTDLAAAGDDSDDDDFLRPTQVMSQPVSRTLPKRVKTS